MLPIRRIVDCCVVLYCLLVVNCVGLGEITEKARNP
jgi:hypothetical protein